MEYLAAQLFALIMIWLPLCALTLLPFVAIVLPERPCWWRVVVAVLGGYLILVGVTGMYIYMIVPAQYTKYHIWTRDPASSSLGEQYGEAIERARSIAVREPEAARQLRERVEQDRRDFLDDWLRLCLFGLAGPLLLLLRVWRRGIGLTPGWCSAFHRNGRRAPSLPAIGWPVSGSMARY